MYPFLEDTWEKSTQIEFLKEDGKKKVQISKILMNLWGLNFPLKRYYQTY